MFTRPVLITGVAGFIGFHTARALLAQGCEVVGVDDFNPYYDPAIKRARADLLADTARRTGAPFTLHTADIAAPDTAVALHATLQRCGHILHLAAQAGVRDSVRQPLRYGHSNLTGFLQVLEWTRRAPRLEHLVYASSGSVYGAGSTLPFALTDAADRPASLYAATKRAGELLAHSYSAMDGLPATGLRFFTVYGPHGRPDMATYDFTRRLYADEPITLYHHGPDNAPMQRDFTHVEDVVSGILAALRLPPEHATTAAATADATPHRIYNLGSGTAVPVPQMLALLEQATGRRARIRYAPAPAADLPCTCADISASTRLLGYHPATPLADGLRGFVAWYRANHAAAAPPEGAAHAEHAAGNGCLPAASDVLILPNNA